MLYFKSKNNVSNSSLDNVNKSSKIKEFSSFSKVSVEMMGLIGAGNNPMVGMTVAVAVSIEEAAKAGKF